MIIKNRLNNLVRKRVVSKSDHFKVMRNDFSIIASNCNGGVLLHDLGLPFNTPFINLWICSKDFIKLLKNFKEYMSLELQFPEETNKKYPVGILGDIEINFEHYKSKEEALTCWNRRKERINYDNLVVIFTDRDGCEYSDLIEFDSLNYKKVVFTHINYECIKSAFFIPGFEKDNQVGVLTAFKPKKLGVRWYDDYNFAGLINT